MTCSSLGTMGYLGLAELQDYNTTIKSKYNIFINIVIK